MTDDPQFEKSEFVNVIGNLLKSKPLPKKQVQTSKKTKTKSVISGKSTKARKVRFGLAALFCNTFSNIAGFLRLFCRNSNSFKIVRSAPATGRKL